MIIINKKKIEIVNEIIKDYEEEIEHYQKEKRFSIKRSISINEIINKRLEKIAVLKDVLKNLNGAEN